MTGRLQRPVHAVVMGVSGCGKSVAGARIAQLLDVPLIEGDAFHPQANRDKMARGEALTDADRAGWLQRLAGQLHEHPQGAVLACSALRRSYREVLRSASPGLAFIHLAITQAESARRVGSRSDHFYPASLVASQFQALEDPAGEAGVLTIDGTLPIAELAAQAAGWLREHATG